MVRPLTRVDDKVDVVRIDRLVLVLADYSGVTFGTERILKPLGVDRSAWSGPVASRCSAAYRLRLARGQRVARLDVVGEEGVAAG